MSLSDEKDLAVIVSEDLKWVGWSSVLRPCQHSIGYMVDGFYRSKDPTNSIKVLKEEMGAAVWCLLQIQCYEVGQDYEDEANILRSRPRPREKIK